MSDHLTQIFESLTTQLNDRVLKAQIQQAQFDDQVRYYLNGTGERPSVQDVQDVNDAWCAVQLARSDLSDFIVTNKIPIEEVEKMREALESSKAQ